MTNQQHKLLPLFDTLEHINKQDNFDYLDDNYHLPDIKQAQKFLMLYQGSKGTFNSYRREIERLIHWTILIKAKTLVQISQHDLKEFVDFCMNPPKSWIGLSKPMRFIERQGQRIPNAKWRPFVATIPKALYKKGLKPEAKHFELGSGSIREIFAILGSFYNYLLDEEYVFSNPVALLRQKSKFIRKSQSAKKIRRLSNLQWQYVISIAQNLAEQQGEEHERTLFILSALYSMYLRISELAVSSRWSPTMNDFYRDSQQQWWFTTVGKGNKERQIAVSDTMLEALKRWRKYLLLSPTPTAADNSPLLPKARGRGGIKSVNYLRQLVQISFDRATDKLYVDGLSEEAEALQEATSHWLRHTGISEDVKVRPREHVRDDAGHSSSAITDHYIDIELHERHQSARKKIIQEE